MFEVREKPKMVERAYLVGVQTPAMRPGEGESLLEELAELVRTLGIEVIAREIVPLREPQPRFLVGQGKTEAIIAAAKAEKCDVVVFDDELSPAQQRNWETESKLCVIDRQEVIIDIFAGRARTKEATLQVNLARMQYSLPRLKRAWTHLSRQRGGGGTVVRGQGETQLEADRRMVKERISKLKKELVEVRQHRDVQRQKRLRRPVPTAALVGYTNAGKSSLLNALTGSTVGAEDKLFATLDPTTRQCFLPDGQKVLLTDTVGFVRRLPHGLIDAFRATLEEAVLADVLLHVVDVSSPEAEAHQQTTLEVLRELGADEERILTVYNKVDRLPSSDRDNPFASLGPKSHRVSAHNGQGLTTLMTGIGRMIAEDAVALDLLIPYDRYDLVGRLHDLDSVTDQENRDEGVYLHCLLPLRQAEPFRPYEISSPWKIYPPPYLMLDLLLNTAFLRLDMTTRSLSNFAAAMLIGKIVYFYIIVLPVSKRNLDAENRTRLLRSLYPKNYYFGMLCGLTVALCSFDLGRWWYASMGVMIFLTEASGRVYFHPQTVRYKKELESMSPEEKIASGLPAKARKLKMRRIAVNIGTVVLGFFSITQLFR